MRCQGVKIAILAVSVSGNTGEQFRGFFVQARLMSDDTTRVGVFTVTESLSRLSSCPVTTVSYSSYAQNLFKLVIKLVCYSMTSFANPLII